MKLSAVFKWAIIIALLLAVTAGGVACWVWANMDQLVHKAVEDNFRKNAPGWDIQLERTRFDGANKLHVYNLRMKDQKSDEWLVEVPEVIVTVDRDEYVRSQQIVVRAIKVRQPKIRVVRSSDGKWNWQGLPPLKLKKRSLPAWSIEDAKFDIALDYGDSFPAARFELSGGHAKLDPTSSRSFGFEGGLNLADVGNLLVKGNLNLDHGQWKVTGQMNKVVAGDRLLQFAASTSPEISDRLQSLNRQVQMAATRLRGETVRLASNEDLSLSIPGSNSPSFGLAGLLNIAFDVVSNGDGTDPEFRVLVGLQDGTVDNGALPFTLHNVDALIYRDNKSTRIRITNAKNDQTQLALEALVGTDERGAPIGFVRTNIQDLPLDDRVRSILPRSFRKILDPLHATGLVSIQGQMQARDGQWIPEKWRLDVRNGTSIFEKFRYPVDAVSGSMVQRPDENIFDIRFDGRAGQRPVALTGYVRNPGPKSEVLLQIKADDIPLDENFHAAFDEKGRDVISKLGIGGFADGNIQIYRAPQVGFKAIFEINAAVREGQLTYTNFPYALTNLTGNIKYTSQTRSWEYSNLQAFHNNTRVTGEGVIDGTRVPGLLHLKLAAADATLTNDLRSALGPGLQELWDQVSPTGEFDMNFDIKWLTEAGRPVWVTVPRARVRNATIKPLAFPYRLENVQAELSYVPGTAETPDTGRLSIKRMIGRHGNTKVDAAGWATHRTNGEWTLHFDRLIGKDIVANSDLLLALPEGLREAFQVLNPTAPFGLENTELEFRGAGNPAFPVTAAWHTETVLEGGAISAGMDLKNVRGRVTNHGYYGPDGLRNEGEVKLQSVEVLEHKLTNIRGPYRIKDTQLWIGAPEVFRQTPLSVPVNKRITAEAFGGQLTCDARISLTEASPYQVFVTVADSDLRTYANIHMPAERNMSGKMNGWIHLHGAGPEENAIKGNGQLQVSPAAIYEMPVMVNLLQALGTLNFSVADSVAFRHALLNFDVKDRNFLFKEIDLIGNAISLRGRGRVDFDSRLSLDFYSKPPRTVGGIPILSQLVSGATSNWVNVKVDGTLERPRTHVQPNINLNGALRPFLQAFDEMARPQMRVPFAGLPGTVPR